MSTTSGTELWNLDLDIECEGEIIGDGDAIDCNFNDSLLGQTDGNAHWWTCPRCGTEGVEVLDGFSGGY